MNLESLNLYLYMQDLNKKAQNGIISFTKMKKSDKNSDFLIYNDQKPFVIEDNADESRTAYPIINDLIDNVGDMDIIDTASDLFENTTIELIEYKDKSENQQLPEFYIQVEHTDGDTGTEYIYIIDYDSIYSIL